MKLPAVSKTKFVLVMLFIAGFCLRFYNLGWGDGYLFHPDERNIGMGVQNISFSPWDLNPDFFAYGSLPIYLIYTTSWLIQQTTTNDILKFETYLLVGRVFSAIASMVVIYLTYYLTKKALKGLKSQQFVTLITTVWVTFLPGMIQFAHFTTFETFLTLEYLLLLIFSYELSQTGTRKAYLLTAIMLGVSIATKITSVVMLPVVILAHLFFHYNRQHNQLKLLDKKHLALLASLLIAGVTAALGSAYHIIDTANFNNSFAYESGVANGSMIVFYTQQFLHTIPGYYQLTRVFPYILTIPLTLLSVIALLHLTILFVIRILRKFFKKTHFSPREIFVSLLLTSIICYLGFHFTLYVKWTRYMIPVLPFLAILSGLYINSPTGLFHKIFHHERIGKVLIFIISAWVIGAGVSFFQIYIPLDSRVEAAEWANRYIEKGSLIISEPYDLGIVPFNSYFPVETIKLPPLYDIEHDHNKEEYLKTINESNYFVNLSPRVYQTRFRLPAEYPQGYLIYKEIFEDPSRWKLVARFSRDEENCSLWTLYCLNGRFLPDETFAVFDHPTIQIYRHIN